MDTDSRPHSTSRSDKVEERRHQIMEAALNCFARKGYYKTTMDDIVAESGLSKGSLYWYFDSKDELFISMSKAFFFDELADIEVILKGPGPVAGRLKAVAQAFVQFYDTNRDIFNVFFEFWLQSSFEETTAEIFRTALLQFREPTMQAIEEGIKNGELEPVDPEQLTWALLAAFDGLMLYSMILPEHVHMSQSADALIEAICKKPA
jgi:AcrR family transcriptional regulator